jgi:RNA polymerase sporulation-specific sigma factor
MIVGEMRRYLRDGCALKVGRSTKDLAYRALSAREELARAGKEPDNEAIAAYLGCGAKDVCQALEAISDPLSIYEPFPSCDGEDLTLSDRIADSDGDSWIDRIALKEALRRCTRREAEILRLRYYNGKTQTEAAAEAGVSQAQISRIEKAALEKLKKYMT